MDCVGEITGRRIFMENYNEREVSCGEPLLPMSATKEEYILGNYYNNILEHN